MTMFYYRFPTLGLAWGTLPTARPDTTAARLRASTRFSIAL